MGLPTFLEMGSNSTDATFKGDIGVSGAPKHKKVTYLLMQLTQSEYRNAQLLYLHDNTSIPYNKTYHRKMLLMMQMT